MSRLEGRRPKNPILGLLVFFMGLRILSNTLQRLVYPFLPELSRAFGVSPAVFSNAIAVRSMAGVSSPFLAHLADSRGRKFGMLLGTTLFIAGLGLFVIWPTFEMFMAGLAIAALGKYTADPAMQAFISDEAPPGRRGESIAIVELGWSMSYFIGISVVRVLMERFGWFAPFPVLLFLGIVSLIAIFVVLPVRDRERRVREPLWPRLGAILANPVSRAALLVGLTISAGNELVSVSFAVWLEDWHGLQIAALATAAVVIGVAELFGESLVGVLTDRLGSVRAVGSGIVVNSALALLLPLFGRSVTGAFVGLFLFYFTFEYLVVSAVSMMTELASNSRATLMGLFVGFVSVGRMGGAWISLPLYGAGITAIVVGTVLMNLVGIGLLSRVKVN